MQVARNQQRLWFGARNTLFPSLHPLGEVAAASAGKVKRAAKAATSNCGLVRAREGVCEQV